MYVDMINLAVEMKAAHEDKKVDISTNSTNVSSDTVGGTTTRIDEISSSNPYPWPILSSGSTSGHSEEYSKANLFMAKRECPRAEETTEAQALERGYASN